MKYRECLNIVISINIISNYGKRMYYWLYSVLCTLI